MKYVTVLILLLVFVTTQNQTFAQTQVECGDIVEAEIDSDETHEYSIEIEDDLQLVIHAEGFGSYTDIYFYLTLYASDGDRLERDSQSHIAWIITEELDRAGIYTIEVSNSINSDGGDYHLYIACIDEEGEIINSEDNRFVHALECGSILDNEIDSDETHFYYIYMEADDELDVFVEEFGSYTDIYFYLTLYAPDGDRLERDSQSHSASVETDELPQTGIYTIEVSNSINSDGGDYTIFIGCTVNNESIQPGDNIEDD